MAKSVEQKLQHLAIKAESENMSGVTEMSDWERGFCQDVWKNTWLVRKSLSEKVEKIIHEIYDRYFSA